MRGCLAGDERVGRRIDAAHAGDEDEIAGAGGKAPGAGRGDGAGGGQHGDAGLGVVGGHRDLC